MTRLLSVAALLLLAACTGSTEPPNPVLLVVGFEDATGAKVGLVRDNLEGEIRLTFLGNSVRPLPAPAADFDVVDREGGRNALVVLSRGDLEPGVPGTGSTGRLTTFSLTGIDPANPAGFRETAEVVINNLARPEILGPTPVFCPKRVQVTQSGNYAAVLNDPSLCGLQALPFIDILDLRGSRLLQRLTGVGGLSSSGIYLAQGASEDLLYFAAREAGSLELRRATMPRPGQTFGPDYRVPVTDITNVQIADGQNDALDLQRSGSGADERLVFLYRNSLLYVSGFSGEEEVGGFVDTAEDNALVVRDDERSLEGTFVLSIPRANTLTFVPPPESVETVNPEATASLGAVGATLEPVRDNAYFALPGRVALLPLASFSSGDDLPDLRPVDIPQLTSPSFVTFAQAVPSAAAP